MHRGPVTSDDLTGYERELEKEFPRYVAVIHFGFIELEDDNGSWFRVDLGSFVEVTGEDGIPWFIEVTEIFQDLTGKVMFDGTYFYSKVDTMLETRLQSGQRVVPGPQWDRYELYKATRRDNRQYNTVHEASSVIDRVVNIVYVDPRAGRIPKKRPNTYFWRLWHSRSANTFSVSSSGESELDDQAPALEAWEGKKRVLRVLETFSGCGGFSYMGHASDDADIQHCWANDIVRDMCWSYKVNNADTHVLHGSIDILLAGSIRYKELADALQLHKPQAWDCSVAGSSPPEDMRAAWAKLVGSDRKNHKRHNKNAAEEEQLQEADEGQGEEQTENAPPNSREAAGALPNTAPQGQVAGRPPQQQRMPYKAPDPKDGRVYRLPDLPSTQLASGVSGLKLTLPVDPPVHAAGRGPRAEGAVKVLEMFYVPHSKAHVRDADLIGKWDASMVSLHFLVEEEDGQQRERPIRQLADVKYMAAVREFCLHDRSRLERGRAPCYPLPQDVDVITGGPPCQGISGLNRNKEYINILESCSKNGLIRSYVSLIAFFQPKYMFMEQVLDILSTEDGYYFKYMINHMLHLRYQVRAGILAAGCFGCPQVRWRVVVCAAAYDEQLPNMPAPTHMPPPGDRPMNADAKLFNVMELRRLEQQEGQRFRPLLPPNLNQDAFTDLPPCDNFDWADAADYAREPLTPLQMWYRQPPKQGASLQDRCRWADMLMLKDILAFLAKFEAVLSAHQAQPEEGVREIGRMFHCNKVDRSDCWRLLAQFADAEERGELPEFTLQVLQDAQAAMGYALDGLDGPAGTGGKRPKKQQQASGKGQKAAAGEKTRKSNRLLFYPRQVLMSVVYQEWQRFGEFRSARQLGELLREMEFTVGSKVLRSMKQLVTALANPDTLRLRDYVTHVCNTDDWLRIAAVARQRHGDTPKNFRSWPGVATNPDGSVCTGCFHAGRSHGAATESGEPAGCIAGGEDHGKGKGTNRVDDNDRPRLRELRRTPCPASMWMLPTGDQLSVRWAITYKSGRSGTHGGRQGCYGRIEMDEVQQTVVGRPEPHNLKILMPHDDCVLPVRFNARCQGFPDSHVLVGFSKQTKKERGYCGNERVKTRYVQIGNAVAPPVAMALGCCLGKAAVGKAYVHSPLMEVSIPGLQQCYDAMMASGAWEPLDMQLEHIPDYTSASGRCWASAAPALQAKKAAGKRAASTAAGEGGNSGAKRPCPCPPSPDAARRGCPPSPPPSLSGAAPAAGSLDAGNRTRQQPHGQADNMADDCQVDDVADDCQNDAVAGNCQADESQDGMVAVDCRAADEADGCRGNKAAAECEDDVVAVDCQADDVLANNCQADDMVDDVAVDNVDAEGEDDVVAADCQADDVVLNNCQADDVADDVAVDDVAVDDVAVDDVAVDNAATECEDDVVAFDCQADDVVANNCQADDMADDVAVDDAAAECEDDVVAVDCQADDVVANSCQADDMADDVAVDTPVTECLDDVVAVDCQADNVVDDVAVDCQADDMGDDCPDDMVANDRQAEDLAKDMADDRQDDVVANDCQADPARNGQGKTAAGNQLEDCRAGAAQSSEDATNSDQNKATSPPDVIRSCTPSRGSSRGEDSASEQTKDCSTDGTCQLEAGADVEAMAVDRGTLSASEPACDIDAQPAAA